MNGGGGGPEPPSSLILLKCVFYCLKHSGMKKVKRHLSIFYISKKNIIAKI